VFTAGILRLAVTMPTWRILWMSRRVAAVSAELRELGQAVRLGQRSLAALGAVVAVAVMREGSEVTLFLNGVVAATRTRAVVVASGGAAGLVLVAALSWRGLVIRSRCSARA
jgi:high-affinity iron transporter